MEISGKRILVTGATRGIGRALAERLAAQGARLALVARSAGPLQELASALHAKAFPVDLGDAAAADGLIERIEADGGGIDVLVNNAAVSNIDYVLQQSPASIEALFRINLLAPIHLCQQIIKATEMLEEARGGPFDFQGERVGRKPLAPMPRHHIRRSFKDHFAQSREPKDLGIRFAISHRFFLLLTSV